MYPQSALLRMLGKTIIVVRGDQVGNSAPQIEKETVAGIAAGQNATGNDGQKRNRIVPSSAQELLTESGCPVCPAGLPTICHQIAEASADVRFGSIEQRNDCLPPVVIEGA